MAINRRHAAVMRSSKATRGAKRPRPQPPADAVAAVIAHLRGEEPLSAAALEEHERFWRAVEDETRVREQANDRAEGLL